MTIILGIGVKVGQADRAVTRNFMVKLDGDRYKKFMMSGLVCHGWISNM